MNLTTTPQRHDAYEVYVGGDGQSRVLITCEHASNRLPAPWSWSQADNWVSDLHWAWDPGAADLAREVADRIGATVVLAHFSRLLIDPNRSLDSSTLFRDEADGTAIQLNKGLDETERLLRIEMYYRPYHAALEQCVAALKPSLVLGMHSFTPVYDGDVRAVEVGVLQTDQKQLALAWVHSMANHSFDVRLDEPYAGGGGFMYSPQRHATAAGCPALELEIRQDHCTDAATREILTDLICRALADGSHV